jgi:putative ABC transport system permease protein
MRGFFLRVRELISRKRIASEQDEEFRFHLEMETERNARLGMSNDDARRAAVLAFGARERFRDETHDARGFIGLENFVREVRHAVRRLSRAPTFAPGAILTLGIGLGAATGIGGIAHGVLLRDLPYQNPDALVRVSLNTPGIPRTTDLHTDASYVHLATGATRSFEGFAAYYTNNAITLNEGDEAERVHAALVSPGLFALLGVRPVIGRFFAPSDTAWVESSPVIISEELWDRRFGRDSAIVGRRIRLNFGDREVVGVLPRSFDFPSTATQVWYPARIVVNRPSLNSAYFDVIARLRPGVSVAAATTELNSVLPSLPSRYPGITPEAMQSAGINVTLQPMKAAVVAPVRSQLLLLSAMVLVVLVVAACNVINLFLLRAERAQREVAIVTSLGATRFDIARRFTVEGLLLGAASLVIGLPMAAVMMRSRLGFTSREIPRLDELSFGAGHIVAIVVAALVIGALIGLTTLTRTTSRATRDHLANASTRTTSSLTWRQAQRGLVAVQIAMALALVVTAGLLGRSFWNLRNARLGFNAEGLTTFEVSLPFSAYLEYRDAAAFHTRVTDALRALPGSPGAASVRALPLVSSEDPDFPLRFELADRPGGESVPMIGSVASSEYFQVIGIPIRQGRSFATSDLRGEAAVVLSESVARALFGNANAVGQRIRRVDSPRVRATLFHVIGVVGDVPGQRIEDGPAPMIYFPLQRDGDGVPRDSLTIPYIPRSVQYVVRSAVPPSAETIQGILREVDPRVPAMGIRQVATIVEAATARASLLLILLGVSGAAALVLGVVGVYSVASYAAAQREREFGVRMALGAAPQGVARLVLREGAMMALLGIGAGLVVAFAGARLLSALLYQVSPANVTVFAGAVLAIGVVTLVATLIPARRAARTDPAVVLRGE